MKYYVSIALLFLSACNSGSNGGGANASPEITTKGSQFFTPEETLSQAAEIESKGYACGVAEPFRHRIDIRLRTGTQFIAESMYNNLRASVIKTVRTATSKTLIFDGLTTDLNNPGNTSRFTQTYNCTNENGNTTCKLEPEPTLLARINAELTQSLNDRAFYLVNSSPKQDECDRQIENGDTKLFGGRAFVAGIGYRGLRIEVTNTYKIVCPDGTTSHGTSNLVAVMTSEIASSSPTSCNQMVYAWLKTIEPKDHMELEYQLTGFTP